jgi:hypothetical protein
LRGLCTSQDGGTARVPERFHLDRAARGRRVSGRAIIAILAAILFPVFAQTREKARQAACLSHVKQIATAIALYRQDFYMDLHAKCSRYGQGSTQAEKVASVERAFPYDTAVAPVPPLPAPGTGARKGCCLRWVW